MPTPTPTPSVSPGCSNYLFKLQDVYYATQAGPFNLSGTTDLGSTILIESGVTLSQLQSGFTATICTTITGGTIQSIGSCDTLFNYVIFIPSPTPTPSITPTPTPDSINIVEPKSVVPDKLKGPACVA